MDTKSQLSQYDRTALGAAAAAKLSRDEGTTRKLEKNETVFGTTLLALNL